MILIITEYIHIANLSSPLIPGSDITNALESATRMLHLTIGFMDHDPGIPRRFLEANRCDVFFSVQGDFLT
jgi:hypothetical protein